MKNIEQTAYTYQEIEGEVQACAYTQLAKE